MAGKLQIGPGIAASGNYGSQIRNSEAFPDPFCDAASLYMPESIGEALQWCEFILQKNGTYKQALSRIVSHFITTVEIEGDDPEEKKKYKEFLEQQLNILSVLQSVGMDMLTYGNSFTSLIMPIRRYLSCPKCGLERPIKHIYNNPHFNFKWHKFEFHASCPACKYAGKWHHNDRRSNNEEEVIIHRWSPHEMEILHRPMRQDELIWKIPEDYRKGIKEGMLCDLESWNWEIIEAVKQGENLRFDKGTVYHMKEPAPAGLKSRGWGISRVLSNFTQAWYVQVLTRYNESICLDYMVPFRVVTPSPKSGSEGMGDPAVNQSLGGFRRHMERLLRERRRDPAKWHIMPQPVEYQALGGEANQLAPKELLDQGMNVLLNSIGIPVELYQASLTTQAAPAALRLFEASWGSLVTGLNDFLQMVVDQISERLGWEPVTAKLKKVTHADDMNSQMAKLQLMMGRQISQTSGLESMNMNYDEEQKKMLEEEQRQAEMQADMQKKMDQAAQMEQMAPPGGSAMAPGGMPPGPGGMPPAGGGMPPAGGAMPPGGAPPAPGGAPMDPAAAGGAPPGPAGAAAQGFQMSQGMQPMSRPTTPEEMMQMADQKATEMLGLPDSQRKSELIKLKKEDPTLHALVRSLIDQKRNEAQQMGGQQVMQQMYGGGGMQGGMA